MLDEKVVRRGEVWWVKSMGSFGHEYGAGRPGVVISGDKGNETNPTVIIAYTTTEKKPPMPINVRVMIDKVPNVVLCNAVNTVDKARLNRKMWTLTDSEMVRVGGGLAVAQCIPQYQKPNPMISETKQEDPDVAAMKMEIDMWRRMYEKTMDQLVELRVETVIARRIERMAEPVLEPVVLEPEVSEIPVEKPVIKHALVEPDTGVDDEPEEPKKPKAEWDGVKVNVNTVPTATELKRRTGMGYRTAAEIVKVRDEVGKYEKLDDLLALDHFGNTSMKRYGHMLTVADEEPAEEPVGEPTEKKNSQE